MRDDCLISLHQLGIVSENIELMCPKICHVLYSDERRMLLDTLHLISEEITFVCPSHIL